VHELVRLIDGTGGNAETVGTLKNDHVHHTEAAGTELSPP
jgi:hypothetical protein